MKRALIALALTLHLGCGTATTTVVSLQDIDCVSCGEKIVEELERTPGVRRAEFDRRRVEVLVEHDAARIAEAAVVAQVEAWGWPAVLGPGSGRYLPGVEFPAGADVLWLTRDGAAVALETAFVAGKVTVVDFGATWCRPCRAGDAFLARRLQAGGALAVRKVDIVDWDSAVAQQHLSKVEQLPYFVIFDPQGRERARVMGFDEARLSAALDAAAP